MNYRPTHLTPAPRTDDEIWRDIEFQFSQGRDLAQLVRFESREDAVGIKTKNGWKDTSPRWHDEEVGHDVWPWLLIRHNDALTEIGLEEVQEAARSLIPSIDDAIRARSPTLEFLQAWGLFRHCVGMLATAYFAGPDDLHGARITEAKRKKSQLAWVGWQLRNHQDAGMTPQQAEAAVFGHVRSILKQGQFTGEFGAEWFRDLLSMDEHGAPQNLKSTYTSDGHMTREKLATLREEDLEGAPPLPQL